MLAPILAREHKRAVAKGRMDDPMTHQCVVSRMDGRMAHQCVVGRVDRPMVH
jgi:hypothetical protein